MWQTARSAAGGFQAVFSAPETAVSRIGMRCRNDENATGTASLRCSSTVVVRRMEFRLYQGNSPCV